MFQGTLLLWEQAVSGDVTLLPPYWFPTRGSQQQTSFQDFLSGHNYSVDVHVGQECVLELSSL